MTVSIPKDLLRSMIAAVEEEANAARALANSFTLGEGIKLPTASSRYLYSFHLANPPRLQEEAVGRLIVSGREVECVVISRRNDGLDVATFVDLGDRVESATLSVDRSELLSILAARLESVGFEQTPFTYNSDLAASVLDLSKIEPVEAASFTETPEDLTEDQREAVRRCINNKVTFLWGPPGTGKTVTLSAIAWHFFRENKRVLLVSHTNTAVDGTVMGLCKRIIGRARGSLPEGGVTRIGAVMRRALREQFGAQISLDALADVQRRKVLERMDGVRREIDASEREVERIKELSGQAARLQVLQEELASLQKMLSEAKSSESALATVLRVLRIRYGSDASTGTSLEEVKRSIKSVSDEIFQVATLLEGASAEELDDQLSDTQGRITELHEAIADLEALAEDAESSVIRRARVVACTATQALLRCHSLGEFDVVVFEESSMIPLPLLVFLSGLARSKVVVGGDFRQLPPISLSTARVARDWFARDIFEVAGVVDLVDANEESPSLAVLTTQFRGHEGLSKLVNSRFYGGRLKPKPEGPLQADGANLPTWLSEHSAILVDTSSLNPVGYYQEHSKANLIHGLVVRTICASLRNAGLASSPANVGIIAPYRPQVALLEDLLDELSLPSITVGTAHRYQGAERDTIILDLTESPPHRVGAFLGATSIRDSGAKLLNVSLTRAQSRIIVVANLAYLKAQLTEQHVLSGIIEDMRACGSVVDATAVIAAPYLTEEDRVAVVGDISGCQLFQRDSYLPAISADIMEARESVIVASRAVSAQGIETFAGLLRPLVARGVRVEVHLQAAGDGASSGSVEISQGLERFSEIGAVVGLNQNLLLEGIAIDDEVVWLGEASPLAGRSGSDLTVVRALSAVGATVFSRLQTPLSIDDAPLQAVGNLPS